MAIPISYNVRNVLQRPVSTLTTAFGVGLTVMIFIAALSLAAGFRAALRQTGSTDHLIALRKGADSEISSSVPREAASILRAHPGVAVASDGHPLASPEMVVVTNRPRLGLPGSSNVQVRGVTADVLRIRAEIKIVEGRMFTPGTDELIVGRRAAPRFAGCRVGEKIRFGQRDFTVVGHFSAGGSAFESEIWGDDAVLGPALNRDGFQTVAFVPRNAAGFDALKKELEADPRLGIQIRREREFYASQSELLSSVIQFIGVLITLIMGVGAVFGAMNTMYAAVGSRTREVATLLVLGFSPLAVMLSFMIESLFLSLIGGAIGCVLALPINGIATSTTNWASFSEVAFAFQVTPMALVSGMIFAGLMGLAGGFFPALRAARQPLSRALRAL